MITGIITTLIQDASIFGLPFIMPVGDVLTAFDLIRHDDIGKALFAKGVSTSGIRAELRELEGVHIVVEMPGGISSSPVPLLKAGIQGGVRTPDQFNAIMENALYKPVQRWAELGWGIRVADNFMLTHLIWCDNIF